MDRPDFWKITIEERTKHDTSFAQLGPINGFITGEKAREFFMKSQLATSILGQIWNLADLNKDGKLDKKEFSIACSLIKKVLTNGQSILPSSLPSSLLVEPAQRYSPVITSPANNSITLQPQPNSPLFNATFPQSGQQFVSPTNNGAAHQQTNLFPGLSMNSLNTSTPTNGQFGPSSRAQPLSTMNPTTNLVSTMSNGMSMSMSSLANSNQPAFNTPNNNLMLVPYGSNFMGNLSNNQFGNSYNKGYSSYRNIPADLNRYQLHNPLAPIPSTSRMKYSQMFQSNDPSSTGFIAGQTAKTLLMQTALAQGTLAQVWSLADYDKDGKLSLEEFIIAMHLCDFSKAGNNLPAVLPVELQPQRAKTATLPITSNSNVLDIFTSPLPSMPVAGAGVQEASSGLTKQQQMQNTFEDKRRENFDRGNAILEAKRAALREQEEREKKEREEKERQEAEKRQRIREEQERRRQADIERQMERQRILDAQREEERKKIFEQREIARQELLRQQRAEWERQKKQELEVQKLKLQEQLSTLKARDKNLEYDMQTLNEKIASYKTKINDTQTNLNDLNNLLETTRYNYQQKQTEMERKQRELQEYQQNLHRIRQEKTFLNEKQNNLNLQSPYGEEPHPEANVLKQKQLTIQQLRDEMEKMELQINTARSQMNNVRSELETSKQTEMHFYQENDRVQNLIDLKRPNNMKHDSSFSQSMELANAVVPFKASFSSNNIRSATPKENYDAFKDEIFKIQQTTAPENPYSPPAYNPPAQVDPFQAFQDPFSSPPQNQLAITSPQSQNNFSADWSNVFNASGSESNGLGQLVDPFAVDPFNNHVSNQVAKTNDFDNAWSNQKNNGFQASFMNQAVASSTDNFDNGFGADDNWAFNALANTKNSKTDSASHKTSNATTTTTNNENDNWANFDNEPAFTEEPFNNQQPAPNNTTATTTNTQPILLNATKFSAQYAFEASREDELSLQIGDIINVDLSVQTDEGWLYGECLNRVGVFPAAFTVKLDDFNNPAAVQVQAPTMAQLPSTGSFRSIKSLPVSNSFPNQQALNSNMNNTTLSTIKNYFISIYPYQSTEVGDLVFREFEIINVIDTNEDWLTGQIVGTGNGPANPLRAGIFPANFVIKFNFSIEYIGKHTIGMATEPYQAKNGGELTLNPAESQLIAIKKISPDGKWSFGESYDLTNTMKRGWFPIQSVMPLIDAGVAPLYVPPGEPKSTTSPISSTVTTPTSGKQPTSPKSPSISNTSTPPPPSSVVSSPTGVKKPTEIPAASKPLSNASVSNTTDTSTSKATTTNHASSNSSTKTTNLDASSPPATLANALASASSPLRATANTTIGSDSAASSSKPTSNENLNSESTISNNNNYNKNEENSESHDLYINSEIDAALALPETNSEDDLDRQVAGLSNSSNYIQSFEATFENIGNKLGSSEVDQKVCLANSDSLFQLCKDLNRESSVEDVQEQLDELFIEEPVSSTPKSNKSKESISTSTPTESNPSTPTSTNAPTTTTKATSKTVNSSKAEAKAEPAAAPAATALPSGIIDQVIALYDFASTTPETIGFPKDAVINIIEKSGDWWLGEYNGKMGLLPYNYVQSIVKANGETDFDEKTYLEKIRAEYVRNKNKLASINNRNSLQTDEETAHENGLDSSFEEDEFNDYSVDTDKTMDTSGHHKSEYHNQIEFSVGKQRGRGLLPKEELRFNLTNEIVETEQKYIKDLKFIVEFYKQPLKANRILSRAELEIMFVNLEEIIPINTKFLNSLILRINDANQNEEFPRVGDIFLEHLPKMHVYTKFVAGKRFGEELILEKIKTSTEFAKFISKNLNGDPGDFLLKKMLLLPMQRLTQYQLLIDRLVKSLTLLDDEYKNLYKASKATVDLIKAINSEVGKIDDLERLEWLEDHVNIKEGTGFKFVSQTNIMGPRCINYYGPLVKENEFNKGKDLYGLLFNDSFLLVEAHESLHNEIFKAKKLSMLNVYKQPMLLDTISSVQSRMSSQNGSECSFQIILNGKEMSFRTTNPTLKNEWIKQILKSIEAYRQQKSSIRNSIGTSAINQKEPVGRFLLVIMEAQDLLHTEPEQPKSFCEVEMGGKRFHSQIIESSNPKWNLSMQFSVYDLNKDMLNVLVYDNRQFSPNIFLGKIEIRMLNVYRDQMKENQENGPIPITRCFRMNNVSTGKLMLKMSLSIFS